MTTTDSISGALTRAITLASLAVAALLPGSVALGAETSLGLEEAVALALDQDEWLGANRLREASLQREAVYEGQLPDPQLRLGAANLPVDSFNLDIEPMTMLEVGIMQRFPPGDTLALRQRQALQRSERQPRLREEREARIALEVSQAWLEAYRAQALIALHETHRDYVAQLLAAATVRYQAATGSFRQQDLVRAQVELTKVDDVLIDLRGRLHENRRALARWLPYADLARDIDEALPTVAMPQTSPLDDLDQAARFFATHPRLQAYDKEVAAALTGVEIARQDYKPGVTVGAEYAKRFEGPAGLARSDFLSLSVTLDLPLFTGKRQEPRVEAASLQASALQTERILLVREIATQYAQALARLERLAEREALYEELLESQLETLVETSTAAYATDEGDFEEMVEAYIARHEAQLALLNIDVDRLQAVKTLEYLLTGRDNRGGEDE